MLALRQSENIKAAIEAVRPGLRVELRIIKTTGDKITDVPLAMVGGKGLFVKEIEEALLAGEIDLAVHSMKDMPSELPEGLTIGAVPVREDPRDVLVVGGAGAGGGAGAEASGAGGAAGLAGLPPGARLGTSSLRRAAQVMRFRPDIRIENLRGNLDTRLRKVREGEYDAIILAAAGLHRMGWRDRITAYLDPAEFIPAIGQGALGIEVRRYDAGLQEILSHLHDDDTAVAVRAERGFLEQLEGGCQVPIGGHARVVGDEVELTGMVLSLDGKRQFMRTQRARKDQAWALGRELARRLLEEGARAILEEIYKSPLRGGAPERNSEI